MIRKILVSFILLISFAGISQENNASPYSFYGIGDVKFKGTVENRSMGGLGILPDSIHVNLQNPASYSSLKFTTFTIAGSVANTNFKTDSQESTANRTTFDYLAVALPFNKIGVSFGIMPYSAVGYRVQNTVIGTDGISRDRQFDGSGGLNRVFFGASYQVTPKLSVGADFQYNFGTVETKSIVSLPDVFIQYATREMNVSDYNGVSFNLGAMYNTKFNEKYNWYTSLTYTPQSTLKSSTERELAAVMLTNNQNEVVVDEIDQLVSDEDVKLPSRLSIGSGIGENRKWFAGLEYTFTESNELGNRFDNVTSASFESSHKFAVGGYYIPNYMSFNSYLSRVTYRAGVKYENTGLMINDEQINDIGLTLGVGLPLGGFIGSSNLNVGAEIGRRGTTNAGLIQENYVNVFISLSLNDRWFVKRKFD